MGLTMAQYRSASGQFKEDHTDTHHAHQQAQGQAPHLQQHQRPSSIVHQQHRSQPTQQQAHSSGYSSVYPQHSQTSSSAHAPDSLPYYPHPSPYSTPGATTSGYTSADTPDMMAATMPRPPYPPMSYHTPQSNSPASVASPSGHDQQRGLYGQPASQLHQQNLYYGAQQPQYSSMPTQAAQSPYGAHPQQSHQSMTSQPGMMMSHQAAQHQMAQHQSQHPQAAITSSPRHPKIEQAHPMPSRMQGGSAPSSLGPSPGPPNGAGLPPPAGAAAAVNPNAAPGPIPATTPLVVKQDQNGVQWIAFEYSRDRVKMEYTIRCDVESVNTDELSHDFKTENCVYPRACCPKDQYRGNRLQYETECNTVGWALAQLNPPLRGKRGLIQRAVDSWRNSNQDPRLRSRRVRRMAKINNRKAGHAAHMAATPGAGSAGMPGSGAMGPGGSSVMGKSSLSSMGPQIHHHQHQDGGAAGGDEVGDDYMDQHHHHHQGGSGNPADDVRHAQVFTQYGHYGSGAPAVSAAAGSLHMGHHASHGGPVAASASASASPSPPALRRPRASDGDETQPADLFPDMPEAKKRKFILVEDTERANRLRVRVTLDGVDTHEIPDSFRKGSAVFPRSWFPREMQSPPPSATGSKFFPDDPEDEDGAQDDGAADTQGVGARGLRRAADASTLVKVPMDKGDGEVAIPRVRKTMRGKEVRLNELGYRMAWLQSRVFAGRTVFLQRALDCYRNKTQGALESLGQDARIVTPHYETRPGKRRFNERLARGVKKSGQETS